MKIFFIMNFSLLGYIDNINLWPIYYIKKMIVYHGTNIVIEQPTI